MNTELDTLRTQIVRLAVDAGEGNVTSQDLATVDGSLQELGFSSLSFMRLIDAIENELGVYIDPGTDTERLSTIDGIAALVRQARPDASV